MRDCSNLRQMLSQLTPGWPKFRAKGPFLDYVSPLQPVCRCGHRVVAESRSARGLRSVATEMLQNTAWDPLACPPPSVGQRGHGVVRWQTLAVSVRRTLWVGEEGEQVRHASAEGQRRAPIPTREKGSVTRTAGTSKTRARGSATVRATRAPRNRTP